MQTFTLHRDYIRHFINLLDKLERGEQISYDWFSSLKADLRRILFDNNLQFTGDTIQVEDEDLQHILWFFDRFDYSDDIEDGDRVIFDIHTMSADAFKAMRVYLDCLNEPRYNYSMTTSPATFTPPKGTIITRPMTYAERKLKGRNGYAKYVISELISLTHWSDVNNVKAKAHGTMCTVSFESFENGGRVTISFQGRVHSPSPSTFAIYDKGDGKYSLEKWLTDHDPCFAARLLKNAQKQLRARKSLEGQLSKQMQRSQSPEVDEFI